MGDFNEDLLTSSYDSLQLQDFVLFADLYLVSYQITHHLRISSTWLDLCIVDDQEKLIEFGQHALVCVICPSDLNNV